MQTYACGCGQTLYFENTLCGSCRRDVGWCPQCRTISALDPLDDGRFRCSRDGCGAVLAKCTNYAIENVCNRCIPAEHEPPGGGLCDYCQFNDTVPDLSVDGNRERWARLESAKRRLLFALDVLGLPYGTAADGFEPPLAFSFKSDIVPTDTRWQFMGQPIGRATGRVERVFTGHADGQITINTREADDAEREALRVDFGEAHRTLIGHFRHEIAHYYWDLLVRDHKEPEFIAIFGNHEAPPYQEALEQYYKAGPAADWRERFVSAYASAHPWEDWAETFALYLDISSILDTAGQIGVSSPAPLHDLPAMIDRYRRIGLVMNELSREMGLIDMVPEIITPALSDKLDLVHRLVREAAGADRNTDCDAVA